MQNQKSPQIAAQHPRAPTLPQALTMMFFLSTLSFIGARWFTHLLEQPWSLSALGWHALGFFSACLMADLLSGLVHCFADHIGNESWPIIGPHLVRAFRLHHEDPSSILEHGFIELNWASTLVALPTLLASALFVHHTASLTFTITLHTAILLTNTVHRYAHMTTAPSWVAWLQRHHMILSPSEHARHHRAPYRQAYCIAFGWLNQLSLNNR